jgi:erythromycin esterase
MKSCVKSRTASAFLCIGAVFSLLTPLDAGAAGKPKPVRADPITKPLRDWVLSNLHPLNGVGTSTSFADLEPLRALIGDRPVVAYGEGLHGAAEPLEFRNRLFRFLVEQMGFTAIAIESGNYEGFGVNDYVLGGPGELQAVVDKGFSFGFNRMPQENALVQWMREYNADSRHTRKIQFFGFDGPAGPGPMNSALLESLKFLERVDTAAAADLHRRVDPIVSKMNYVRFGEPKDQYAELSLAQRDQLTGATQDLLALLRMREIEFVAATSSAEYDRAYRTALAAQQADGYLRRIPIGWTPVQGAPGMQAAVAFSDRIKAENIQSIRAQLGPQAKILVFAHRGHIAPPPTTIFFQGRSFELPPMMGSYLQRWIGKDWIKIGNFFAHDASTCGVAKLSAASGSFESHLTAMQVPVYLLDLRGAPPNIAAWLEQPRQLFGPGPPNTYSIGRAFDVIVHIDRVTPSPPCG